MIIDTSALVAILFDEAWGEELFDLVVDSESVGISAGNLVEFSIVVQRTGSATHRRIAERLRQQLGIHVEPFTARQAELARSGFRDYGRGSGHPAALNFGDCFAYALAVDKDEPLLFVGDDFTHTDVRRAR